MKYIKTAVMVFMVLLALCTAAYAAGNYEEELLLKLDIIENDTAKKESIARDEFAHMAIKFMNMDVAEKKDCAFRDVGKDNHYSGDIAALYEMGYVSGNGNLYFSPNDSVLTAHAAKILVSALGYHEICSINNDYIQRAQALGLFDGIDSGAVLTGEACITLLSNALEADVMKTKTFGDTLTFSNNEKYDALYEYFDILTVEDVVTEVNGLSLTGARSDSENRIVAGSGRYKISDASYDDLLGYNVKLFVENKTGKVIYAYEYDNKVSEFDIGDIDEIDDGFAYISLPDKKYSLSDDVDIIYNGNGYFEITPGEIISAYGTVCLIDNNGNGRYDVVKVYDYIPCAVSVVNYDKLSLTDFYANHIPALEDAQSVNVIKNGISVSFNDISQNDIALVAIDKSANHAKILVSDTTVRGTVDESGDNEIIINSIRYKLSDKLSDNEGILNELSPGKYVELRLDSFGKISYIRQSRDDSLNYGYLMDIAFEKGLSGKCSFKILQDNGQINELTTDTDTLKINGEKVTSDIIKSAFSDFGEFSQQIIKYAVNSEGVITRIYSASGDNLTMDFPYLQRAQSDGGFRVFADDGDFLYNSNTVIFSVPMYPEQATDDDYTISSQVKGEYATSQIAAFDVNEYQTAAAVVRKNAATSNNGTVSKDDKNYNPLLVVDKITKTVNYKGEEEYNLYCCSRKGDVRYYVSEDKYPLVKDLERGDVILIRYNKATEHVIDVYKDICTAVNSKEYTHVDDIISQTDGSRWFEWIYGKVYTRFGDTVKISDKEEPSEPSDYRVYSAGTAKVIIVGKDSVRYGSLSNVTPDSEIVLRSRGASVQEIIVYE